MWGQRPWPARASGEEARGALAGVPLPTPLKGGQGGQGHSSCTQQPSDQIPENQNQDLECDKEGCVCARTCVCMRVSVFPISIYSLTKEVKQVSF